MVRTPEFINSWLLRLLRPTHGEGKIISAYRRAKALREIRVSGFTLLRDPYSAASTGQVKLWMHFRTVFKVLQPSAIGYLIQHT